MRTFAATLLLLAPVRAWAWPADADWAGLTDGSASYVDDADDMVDFNAPSYLDLVGDATSVAPVGYWYADTERLYFRMRVDADPAGTTAALTGEGAWVVLINLDSDLETYEYSIAFASSGVQSWLRVYSNASRTGDADDPAENLLWSTAYDASGAVETARLASASSSISLNADYFIDLSLSWQELETATAGAFSEDTGFRVALATAEDESDAPAVDVDLAGERGAGSMNRLSTAWSDEIAIDGDGDGLVFFEEGDYGTDPWDADTDDDGALDGDEVLLLATDPLDCDSDGDELPDGLEAGVSAPGAYTDTATGCFAGDRDPRSTTDPLRGDTDGDARPEWLEDVDQNGRVDRWESDPNVFDVDSDGDGILDAIEVQCLLPQGSEQDQDGDTIEDIFESIDSIGFLLDTDGDGTPDFCDPIPSSNGGGDDTGNGGGGGDDTGNGGEDDTGVDVTGLEQVCGALPFACDGRLTGGSCSSVPAEALWAPALLGLLGVSVRRRRRT